MIAEDKKAELKALVDTDLAHRIEERDRAYNAAVEEEQRPRREELQKAASDRLEKLILELQRSPDSALELITLTAQDMAVGSIVRDTSTRREQQERYLTYLIEAEGLVSHIEEQLGACGSDLKELISDCQQIGLVVRLVPASNACRLMISLPSLPQPQ